MFRMTFLRWWVWLTLVLLLSGCSAFSIRGELPAGKEKVSLSSSTSIGQSFTVHYDGLAGAAILIEPGESKQGSITFHLRSSPHDSTDIRSVTLELEEISATQATVFNFSPLTDSNHTSYFLVLDLQGDGSAEISLSSKLDYPDGALYKNNDAQDQQLAFSLVYSTVHQILGIFTEFSVWLGWMLAGLFLYILPGWALLRFAWPGWSHLSGWVRLGLSGGLSLAIYPILFVLAALVDIRPGWLFAVLPGSMGIGYLIWVNKNIFPRLTGLPGDLRRSLNKPGFASFFHSPDLLLLFLVILVFGTRFWAIRTLDAPMWGDLVQHTVMTQLFLDNLGLFSSWEPYAPYHSLTVHFGFPVHAALFAWLSGLPSYTAALITAQWINGFASCRIDSSRLSDSKKKHLGSNWSCARSRINRPDAGILCQLGAICTIGRSGNPAGKHLAGLGAPGSNPDAS